MQDGEGDPESQETWGGWRPGMAMGPEERTQIRAWGARNCPDFTPVCGWASALGGPISLTTPWSLLGLSGLEGQKEQAVWAAAGQEQEASWRGAQSIYHCVSPSQGPASTARDHQVAGFGTL